MPFSTQKPQSQEIPRLARAGNHRTETAETSSEEEISTPAEKTTSNPALKEEVAKTLTPSDGYTRNENSVQCKCSVRTHRQTIKADNYRESEEL